MKILIVDDNYHHTLIVSDMLASADRDIDIACNGTEALKRTKEKNYDLIILDYEMPGLSGLDVLKLLNSQLSNRRPKVIAMTANEDPKIEEAFKNLDCDAFLKKPLDTEKLLQAV